MSCRFLSRALPTSENSIAYLHMLRFPLGKETGIRKWIPNCVDMRVNAIALTVLAALDILLNGTRLCLYVGLIVPIFLTNQPIFKDFFCSITTLVKTSLAIVHGQNDGLLQPLSHYERRAKIALKTKKDLLTMSLPANEEEKEILKSLIEKKGVNDCLTMLFENNKFDLLESVVSLCSAQGVLANIILNKNVVILPDSIRNILFQYFSCEADNFAISVLADPNVKENIKNNLGHLSCIQKNKIDGIESLNQVIHELQDSIILLSGQIHSSHQETMKVRNQLKSKLGRDEELSDQFLFENQGGEELKRLCLQQMNLQSDHDKKLNGLILILKRYPHFIWKISNEVYEMGEQQMEPILKLQIEKYGQAYAIKNLIENKNFELLYKVVKGWNAKLVLLQIISNEMSIVSDDIRNILFRTFSCDASSFVISVLADPTIPENMKNNLARLSCIQTNLNNGIEAQNQVFNNLQEIILETSSKLNVAIQETVKFREKLKGGIEGVEEITDQLLFEGPGGEEFKKIYHQQMNLQAEFDKKLKGLIFILNRQPALIWKILTTVSDLDNKQFYPIYKSEIEKYGLNEYIKNRIENKDFKSLHFFIKLYDAKSLVFDMIFNKQPFAFNDFRTFLFEIFSCDASNFVSSVLADKKVSEKIKNNVIRLAEIQTHSAHGIEALNQVICEYESSIKQLPKPLEAANIQIGQLVSILDRCPAYYLKISPEILQAAKPNPSLHALKEIVETNPPAITKLLDKMPEALARSSDAVTGESFIKLLINQKQYDKAIKLLRLNSELIDNKTVIELLKMAEKAFWISPEEMEEILGDKHEKIIGIYKAKMMRASLWKKVKAQRRANDKEELARLKENPRVQKSLQNTNFSKRVQIAYGQSLEVYNTFKNDYYVLNHGQRIGMMVINMFYKELTKRYEPQKDVSEFHVLRHATDLAPIPATQTAQWYQNNVKDDHNFMRELICADSCLESKAPGESALDYFSKNYNSIILNAEVARNAVQQYIKDPIVQNQIISKLNALMNKCSQNHLDGGNLYTFCIPKNKFDEMVYFSGPYGKSTGINYTKEDLELMQKGEQISKPIPQCRILTNKLKKENGVKIFVSSTMTKVEKEALKLQVKEIVDLF